MVSYLATCSTCDGEGAIPNEEWQRYNALTPEEFRAVPDAELDALGPEELSCPDCEGRKRVPTEDARPLLELHAWVHGWLTR